jgi:hypothetical protein
MKKNLAIILLIGTIVSCTNSNNEKKQGTAAVKQLKSPVTDSSAEPFLFTDKNGTVYLSWIEKIGKESKLKYSSLVNEQWSEPSVIAAGNNWFVNWADYPVLVADGNNNMIAHYLEKSAAGKFTYDVKYVTSSDNGKTWSQLQEI